MSKCVGVEHKEKQKTFDFLRSIFDLSFHTILLTSDKKKYLNIFLGKILFLSNCSYSFLWPYEYVYQKIQNFLLLKFSRLYNANHINFRFPYICNTLQNHCIYSMLLNKLLSMHLHNIHPAKSLRKMCWMVSLFHQGLPMPYSEQKCPIGCKMAF